MQLSFIYKKCIFSNSSLVSCHPGKTFPMHWFRVDIFSYSGPSGILGSDHMQNTAPDGARGYENRCMFH